MKQEVDGLKELYEVIKYMKDHNIKSIERVLENEGIKLKMYDKKSMDRSECEVVNSKNDMKRTLSSDRIRNSSYLNYTPAEKPFS